MSPKPLSDPGPRAPRVLLGRRQGSANASGPERTGSERTIPLLSEPVLHFAAYAHEKTTHLPYQGS